MFCCSPTKDVAREKRAEADAPATAAGALKPTGDTAAVEIQVATPEKAEQTVEADAEAQEAIEQATVEAEQAAAEMAAAEDMFKDICRDGVKQMLSDFAEGTETPARTPSEEEIAMKRVLTEPMFRKLDLDGSGELDHEEMKVMFKNLGLELTEEEEKEVMRQIDLDGSGEIDYEEFLAWFSRI